MGAITINRYIVICHPEKYARIYSRFNIILMITFIWLFPFGLMTLPLFEVWGKIDYNPKNLLCTIQEKHGEIISFKVFIMAISLLIPSLIIISCYLALYFKVRKIQMALISNEELTTSKSADMKIIKMMFTVFVCFILLILPTLIINILDQENHKFRDLHICFDILFWNIVVVNPFIYVFMNKHYRKAIFELIFYFCKSKNPYPTNTKTTNTKGKQILERYTVCSKSRQILNSFYQYNS